jgi:hypothetical protein
MGWAIRRCVVKRSCARRSPDLLTSKTMAGANVTVELKNVQEKNSRFRITVGKK